MTGTELDERLDMALASIDFCPVLDPALDRLGRAREALSEWSTHPDRDIVLLLADVRRWADTSRSALDDLIPAIDKIAEMIGLRTTLDGQDVQNDSQPQDEADLFNRGWRAGRDRAGSGDGPTPEILADVVEDALADPWWAGYLAGYFSEKRGYGNVAADIVGCSGQGRDDWRDSMTTRSTQGEAEIPEIPEIPKSMLERRGGTMMDELVNAGRDRLDSIPSSIEASRAGMEHTFVKVSRALRALEDHAADIRHRSDADDLRTGLLNAAGHMVDDLRSGLSALHYLALDIQDIVTLSRSRAAATTDNTLADEDVQADRLVEQIADEGEAE